MGMMVPTIFQIPFLKGTFGQHLIASLSTLLIHDDNHLASLHAWEGKFGDSLMRQHLIPWRSSSYVDATVGGRENLQFYPYSCLRTNNIWEGRTVIFQHLHAANWNIKFC